MLDSQYNEFENLPFYPPLVSSPPPGHTQPVRHHLPRIREDLHQGPGDSSIVSVVKEACGSPCVSNPPSTTNPISFLFIKV